MVKQMNTANRPLVFIFGAFAIAMAIVAFVRLSTPVERVPWRNDFDAAQTEARSSGKPMMAYFTAEWCPPCHELKTTTWADAGVEQALAAYVPVRVDVDVNTNVAMRYGIEGMPTYAVLDADGNVLKATAGYLAPDQFLAWLKG